MTVLPSKPTLPHPNATPAATTSRRALVRPDLASRPASAPAARPSSVATPSLAPVSRPLEASAGDPSRRARVAQLLATDRAELSKLETARDAGFLLASAVSTGIPVIGVFGGRLIAAERALRGRWWNRRELLASAAGHIAAFGAAGYGVAVAATHLENDARALEPRITMLRERVRDAEAELGLGPKQP